MARGPSEGHPVANMSHFSTPQRSQMGSGMSKKQQAKAFISRLNQIAEETYNSLFSKQQMKEIAQEMNLQLGSFEAFLVSLNNQGYLLQKGPRSYQLRTADF
jgi:DNA helicase MCM8